MIFPVLMVMVQTREQNSLRYHYRSWLSKDVPNVCENYHVNPHELFVINTTFYLMQQFLTQFLALNDVKYLYWWKLHIP